VYLEGNRTDCVFRRDEPPLSPLCFWRQSNPPLQVFFYLFCVFWTFDPFFQSPCSYSWINCLGWLQVHCNMPLCSHSNTCFLFGLFMNIYRATKFHTLVGHSPTWKF
jgi:hypothetical protein